MSRLHVCGWEINNAISGTEFSSRAGAPTIGTVNVWAGKYNQTSDTSGGAAVSEHIFDFFAGDQANKLYYRYMFRCDQLPSANDFISFCRNAANNNVGFLRLLTTGSIRMENSSGTAIGTTSSPITVGEWYQIEMMHDATTNPGTLEFRLSDEGGNLIFSTSAANNVQGQWNKLLIGGGISSTHIYYIDDLIVNDDQGTAENTWVGYQGVRFIRPLKTGDANAWLNTGGGAGAPNNWNEVDENPPDGVTTVIQGTVLNAEDMYVMEDPKIPGNATPTCVLFGGYHRNGVAADATTAFKYQIRTSPGGTTTQSAAIIPNTTTFRTHLGANSAEVLPFPIIAYTDPDGAPWTPSTVNIQGGVKLTALNVNRIQVSALWGYVTYTTPAISRTAITQARNPITQHRLP